MYFGVDAATLGLWGLAQAPRQRALRRVVGMDAFRRVEIAALFLHRFKARTQLILGFIAVVTPQQRLRGAKRQNGWTRG